MAHLPHRHDREPYGQIRVSPLALEKCKEAQEKSGLSPHAVVTQIVEAWARGFLWGIVKNKRWAGWGAVFGLASLVLVRCVPVPVRDDDSFTKAMPEAPLPGQGKPPCRKPFREISGGCWTKAIDEDTGKQMRGCLSEEHLYQDKDGNCWIPAWPKNRRVPTSTEPQRTLPDEVEP